jgi:uncharacterized protein YdaU (DUF1376 family)
LAQIARLSSREWGKIKPKIAGLFSDGWTHHRIEKELEKSKEKSERRADAGSRGGTAKAMKNKDTTVANATVLPEQKPSNTLASSSQPQPYSEFHSEKKRADGAFAREFENNFWPIWPNKVGKPAAEKSFASARKRASLDQIISGVRSYVDSKPSDRPWLNPATFLNQDRFNDRPATQSPRAGPAHRSNGRETMTQIAMGNFYDEPQPYDAEPTAFSAGPGEPGNIKPDLVLSQQGENGEIGKIYDFGAARAGGR